MCTNTEAIPDYKSAPRSSMDDMQPGMIFINAENRDYYRELVGYYIQQKQYRAFRLAVANPSDRAIHDLYLEVLLQNSDGNLMLTVTAESVSECLPAGPIESASKAGIGSLQRHGSDCAAICDQQDSAG